MIYRGTGFLAVFLAHPIPPPLSHQQGVSLSQSSCVSPVELTDARNPAWPSINHEILSAYLYTALFAHSLPIAVLAGLLDNSCNFKE
jgi:hypothetical protein